MFTGIVDAGEVVKVESGEVLSLWIGAPVLGDCAIGASVAVNGVCLTVVERDGSVCCFQATGETLRRSALGELRGGERVNVERPLRAGEEIGGHVVQGHVDGTGSVEELRRDAADARVRVRAPRGLMRYVVEKGSITVDGVSLTVSALGDDWFEVALIPHTLDVTTFGEAQPGRRVNLEVDVFARYIEKLQASRSAS